MSHGDPLLDLFIRSVILSELDRQRAKMKAWSLRCHDPARLERDTVRCSYGFGCAHAREQFRDAAEMALAQGWGRIGISHNMTLYRTSVIGVPSAMSVDIDYDGVTYKTAHLRGASSAADLAEAIGALPWAPKASLWLSGAADVFALAIQGAKLMNLWEREHYEEEAMRKRGESHRWILGSPAPTILDPDPRPGEWYNLPLASSFNMLLISSGSSAMFEGYRLSDGYLSW